MNKLPEFNLTKEEIKKIIDDLDDQFFNDLLEKLEEKPKQKISACNCCHCIKE